MYYGAKNTGKYKEDNYTITLDFVSKVEMVLIDMYKGSDQFWKVHA